MKCFSLKCFVDFWFLTKYFSCLFQQAKRLEGAQQDENQQQSEAEVWLNQLDIKHLNKFHIQLFLQHKFQQQQMQVIN